MIETVVRYLHHARVPFRLASYPSEEASPRAAHRLPKGGMLVETEIVLLDGRGVLTCFPAGAAPDLAAVGASLGGVAIAGTTRELPDPLRHAESAVPPLGKLCGLALVVDARVASCSVIVFRAFGESDYFEIPYEDFARLEQPKIASFASTGERTAGASPS